MSHDQINLLIMPMSASESFVFEALKQLPATYGIASARRLIRFEDEFNNVFKYESDFEVKSDDGFFLMIEVKSERSMSLSNMVRFVEIDKAIRKNPNTGFMILVWGAEHPSSKFLTRPEFQHLHIYHAKDPSQVVQAINKEFAALHRPA